MSGWPSVHSRAEVIRLDLRCFVARCNCGWEGTDRETRAEAEDDRDQHRAEREAIPAPSALAAFIAYGGRNEDGS